MNGYALIPFYKFIVIVPTDAFSPSISADSPSPSPIPFTPFSAFKVQSSAMLR
jgi:hypothetical protein